LWVLAFALLVVAIAGPRVGSQLVKVEREGIDVVIALDTSLSMLAEDVPPNRLESAKREIMDLIGGLQGDRVGVVAFAGEAVALCPLTVDYDAALMLVRSADVYSISEPGSAIGKAIEAAVSMFGPTEQGDRVVILVTDGEDTGGDPERAARAAAEKGIRVFAIGMGTPKGELIPSAERTVGTDTRRCAGRRCRLDESALQRWRRSRMAVPARDGAGIELKASHDEISGMQKKLIAKNGAKERALGAACARARVWSSTRWWARRRGRGERSRCCTPEPSWP
jgi:Ca-activated chloride channel family protein